MAVYEIIRGDTYVLRRPLFRYELADLSLGPFNLTGCTIRTTWKVAPTPPADDPSDTTGVLKGLLIVNGSGVATTEVNLFMIGPATDGVIEHRVTAAETANLPLGVSWKSDVEVTDANNEVSTFLFEGDTAKARDGYTNRLI